jgi:parallel beta-helix repeat protein
MKKIAFIFSIFMTILSLNGIQVSGTQSGDWTSDNNPYQMIGDVTVPAGTTLNVMPGVIVQAMGNYQIIAQGNIMANGNEQDSIRFVSGLLDQTIIWKGIRLENTTIGSQFSFCRIELGQYGISSINSPVSITYCHFNKNQKGIQAYGIGSANPAQVEINNNLIEFSQHNGILVAQNSNTTIMYNEITNNGLTTQYYGAIQLSNQSTGGSNSPVIAYNHIFGNHKQGIIAWDIVSANAIQPEVHDNMIENNLTGIYFRHASGYLHHNIVINNFIPGDMNSGAGIMVSGSTAQPYFENNIITGNYTGFYLTENANPILGDMSSNHAWAQGENQIANNIDANSVMHSIVCYQYTAPTFAVKAENNLWDYDTAAEIDVTITDFNDNPAFPTIDYDPWIYNIPPIFLAGTVTYPNPPVPTATLELVSANTGTVLNTWTVTINTPFQVPVFNDSLVYIVAHTTDMIEQQYYGAYGGTEAPTATQIIADVQFSIGDLPLATPQPGWYYRRFGAPQIINNHLSFPLKTGWFVYAPTQTYYLYRDGDFLKLSRIEATIDSEYYAFNIDIPPVWMKIDNLDSDESWEQYIGANVLSHEAATQTTFATTGITTFVYGQPTLYDMVHVGENYGIQIFDHQQNLWIDYLIANTQTNTVMYMKTFVPTSVVPDGTLFPLAEDNYWKVIFLQQQTVPFYWVPPVGNYFEADYRLYDNGVQIAETSMSEPFVTMQIPQDGLEHNYTISIYYNEADHFSESSITLTFTENQDEVAPVNNFSVYPNPFNPAHASLTVKYDIPKTTSAKLSVYNLKGQLVWKTEVDKKATELVWNGRDNQGRTCASGLYQMRLIDNKGNKINRKLMLIH